MARADSGRVLARLEATAHGATHGGYSPAMTTDPARLSKAVFEWWWAQRDARRPDLLRHLPPALRPAGTPAGGAGGPGPGETKGAFGTDSLSLEQVRGDRAAMAVYWASRGLLRGAARSSGGRSD